MAGKHVQSAFATPRPPRVAGNLVCVILSKQCHQLRKRASQMQTLRSERCRPSKCWLGALRVHYFKGKHGKSQHPVLVFGFVSVRIVILQFNLDENVDDKIFHRFKLNWEFLETRNNGSDRLSNNESQDYFKWGRQCEMPLALWSTVLPLQNTNMPVHWRIYG